MALFVKKKKLWQKCSFWIYSGKFKVISLRFLEVILNIYGIFLMIFRFLSANFQISSCKFSDFFLQIFKFFKYGHFGPKRPVFGRFWGPPVTFPGGLKGSNWPPRMWNTMFNHVQPMFNPFGLAGTAYGQIWPFRAKKEPFLAIKMA